MSRKRCERTGTVINCSWQCTMIQPLRRMVWQFLTVLNVHIIWPSILLPSMCPREMKSMFPPKKMCSNIYWCSIHDHQKLETMQVTFNSWMNRQTVVHTCNKILFGNKKKQSTDTQNNFKKHCAKQTKKPDSKGYTLCHYIYIIPFKKIQW